MASAASSQVIALPDAYVQPLALAEPCAEPRAERPAKKLRATFVEYEYGYLGQSMLGYRVPTSSKGPKETTLPLEIPDDADDDAMVWGTWPDGTGHSIPIRVGIFRAERSQKRASAGAPVLFRTEKSDNGHSLELVQRLGRQSLLLCL